MIYQGMEDANDTAVPVCLWFVGACRRVLVIFMSEYHEVGMCPRIEGVLSTSYVVRGVVYPHNLVAKDAMVDEGDGM